MRLVGLRENVHVRAAREHLALRPPDERARVRALDLVEAPVEPRERARTEQVEWRVVEDHRRDGAVALQADHGVFVHITGVRARPNIKFPARGGILT